MNANFEKKCIPKLPKLQLSTPPQDLKNKDCKKKKLPKGRSMGQIRNKALKVSYPNVKNELPQYFEIPAPLVYDGITYSE